MTREEAIRVLEEFQVIDDWTMVHLPPMEDAVNMAIEALKAPTSLISRQDAIEAVRKVWYDNDDRNDFKQRYYEMGNNDAVEDAIGYIDALPSADRPKGECRTCARNADNGGYYEPEHRTRCPIQEHYALLKDGYCYLYEPRMRGDIE